MDAAGDTVWTRVFGGTGADWAESVFEMADGTYGLSGTSGTVTTTAQAYVVNVDQSGTLNWNYGLGSTNLYRENFGTRGSGLADSGMVAAGWRTDQDNLDPCQATFLRVQPGATSMAYRRYVYPFVEYGNMAIPTSDGGFLICGAAKDTANQHNDLFLIKRIEGLGWVWDQTIGGPGSDWGCSVVETEPGYYIISGYTESSGSGSFDGWLLRMREEEASVPAVPLTAGAVLFEAPRPNPMGPVTALRFTVTRATDVELAVFDVAGRRVALLAEGYMEPGEHEVTWYGRDETGAEVCPGIYLARLVAGSSMASRKLVLLK
jgi:hypothetical protein